MGTFEEDLPKTLHPLMELFDNSAIDYCLIVRIRETAEDNVLVISSLPPEKRMPLLLAAVKVTSDKKSKNSSGHLR